MADVTYVEDSREFIRIPITVSDAIELTDWAGAVAFTPLSGSFDAGTATWVTAALVAGVDSTHFTVRVMQGVSPTLTPGVYNAHVRLTHTPDTSDWERPIFKAVGEITVS